MRQMAPSTDDYEDFSVINELKKMGFQNFEELAESTGESAQLLRNWSIFHPRRFALILAGASTQVT